MSSTVTQRRKKDEKPVTSSTDDDKKEMSAKQKLEQASKTVMETKRKTLELHASWREYLMRVSFLTLMLSMHQMVQPLRFCYKDLRDSMIPVSWEWVNAMLGESLYECLSMVVACLLLWYLASVPHKKPTTMTETSYATACAMIPMCSYLYFRMKDEVYQCRALSPEEEAERQKHQFPVALAFHFILTGCLYFMKLGIQNCDEQIEIVKTLRATLETANRVYGPKKK